MSSIFLHRNPEIFPDPLTFNPNRWLESDSNDLANYVVPFSKGPRMCLGLKYVIVFTSNLSMTSLTGPCGSLAWAELYLIIGNLFRKVDLELVDTTYVALHAHFLLVNSCS